MRVILISIVFILLSFGAQGKSGKKTCTDIKKKNGQYFRYCSGKKGWKFKGIYRLKKDKKVKVKKMALCSDVMSTCKEKFKRCKVHTKKCRKK